MKIWKLYTGNFTTAHLFFASDEDLNYYSTTLQTLHNGKSVLPNWKPTLLCNSNDSDMSKFILSEKEYWLLTEKAKMVLEPLFKEAAEFLPLYTKADLNKKIGFTKRTFRKKVMNPVMHSVSEEKHYILNVLNVMPFEVIDINASSILYDENSDNIQSIEKLVFRPELIKNKPIFKVNHSYSYFSDAIFVSDQFKKIIQKNNLSGLSFVNQSEEAGGNLVWEI